MKVRCKISGEEFFSSREFQGPGEQVVSSYHPIFFVPPRNLLLKSLRYGRKEYSQKEEKLLFLALLNATGAVEWEVPAEPSEQTVKKYLESIFKLLGWYVDIGAENLKLPRLRVTSYYNTLENIGVFITSWYEARQEWMQRNHKRHLHALLEDRENKIHRAIHSLNPDTDNYRKLLASYAIDAAKVEGEDKRAEWLEILSTKSDSLKVLSYDLEELEDIQDWMVEHLYGDKSLVGAAGNLQTSKVLEHIAKLVKTKQKGRLGFLASEVGGIGNTFKVLVDQGSEEDLERLETELDTSLSPLEPPREEDYKGRLSDYLRAKVAYRNSLQARENLEYLRNNRAEKDRKRN